MKRDGSRRSQEGEAESGDEAKESVSQAFNQHSKWLREESEVSQQNCQTTRHEGPSPVGFLFASRR
jgi:hypothetical protein